MTEYSNILSGSDNLWKYLFTVGVLLISLSIFYPLKQSELIDLKLIDLNTDSSLLGLEIQNLNKDIDDFKLYLKIVNKEIDSVKQNKIDILTTISKIEEIEIEISEQRKIIKEKISNLKVLQIQNTGKENYILELKAQSEDYKWYFASGIIFGLLLSIFGLYKWLIATIISDKLRWKELGTHDKNMLLEIFNSLFKRNTK